jgi:exodeoxyribonuclease VII small subunit
VSAEVEGGADFARWEAALSEGSFEEVYAALEGTVDRLEAGHLPLAESVACFELGARLAQRCEQILAEAELRISRLDGSLPGTWLFDEDEPDE